MVAVTDVPLVKVVMNAKLAKKVITKKNQIALNVELMTVKHAKTMEHAPHAKMDISKVKMEVSAFLVGETVKHVRRMELAQSAYRIIT